MTTKHTGVKSSSIGGAVPTSLSDYGKGLAIQALPPPVTLIQVHQRQQGNPLLKLLRNIKYSFIEGHVGDYSTGSTGIVYLELGYHRLHPNYAATRMQEVGNKYRLKVLLVYVNEQQHHHQSSTGTTFASSGETSTGNNSGVQGVLLALNATCFQKDFTLILAFSLGEAARYIESFKYCDLKPPTCIQEKLPSAGDRSGFGAGNSKDKSKDKVKDANLQRIHKILTSVRAVNKSNANTLLDVFGSVGSILQADEQQLLLCPGLGSKRAHRLWAAFNEPFQGHGKAAKRKITESSTSPRVSETTSVMMLNAPVSTVSHDL